MYLIGNDLLASLPYTRIQYSYCKGVKYILVIKYFMLYFCRHVPNNSLDFLYSLISNVATYDEARFLPYKIVLSEKSPISG